MPRKPISTELGSKRNLKALQGKKAILGAQWKGQLGMQLAQIFFSGRPAARALKNLPGSFLCGSHV
jgi:hypothetical protein